MMGVAVHELEKEVAGCGDEEEGLELLLMLDAMAGEISRYCAELGIERRPTGEEMEEMLRLLKVRRRMRRLSEQVREDGFFR